MSSQLPGVLSQWGRAGRWDGKPSPRFQDASHPAPSTVLIWALPRCLGARSDSPQFVRQRLALCVEAPVTGKSFIHSLMCAEHALSPRLRVWQDRHGEESSTI